MIRAPDGDEFVLAEIDDFNGEVELFKNFFLEGVFKCTHSGSLCESEVTEAVRELWMDKGRDCFAGGSQ
jgi:hypothetical protein